MARATKPKLSAEFITKLDRVPAREFFFDKVRRVFNDIAVFYGFEKIVTPAVEDTHALGPLIKAGFLEDTPPVFCKTRMGEEILLRPSGFFSILRAYESHNMGSLPHPLQLCFEGDSFYTNKEQGIVGRHEIGLVVIDEDGPVAEAEIIQVICKTLEESGMNRENVELRLNTMGCPNCYPVFKASFTSYFRSRGSRLCKNCRRIFKRSPTKIYSCQEERCRILANNAPQILDFLCESCKKHLKGIFEFLDEMKIPYFLDHKLFKFDSWYSSIIFEFVKNAHLHKDDESKIEAESGSEKTPPSEDGQAIVFAEGGRMQKAGELITGRSLDVTGGIIIVDALEKAFTNHFGEFRDDMPNVFFVQLGDLAKRKSIGILEGLRAAGIKVAGVLARDSIKSQLRIAEKVSSTLTLILGQKEALDQTVIIREKDSGIQETIPQAKLIEFLKRKLKG